MSFFYVWMQTENTYMMAATLGRDGRVTYDIVMIDGTIQTGSEDSAMKDMAIRSC